MKPKTYRHLTTGLFCFLFLIFFLLFLLLKNGKGASPTGQDGWGELHREMGVIRLSEIHSGGFIIDEFPLEESTNPQAEKFNENVARCHASLYNEGTVPIRVQMRIHGTKLDEKVNNNVGLCGGFYYFSGEEDPLGGDFAGFLAGGGFTVQPPEDKHMTLYWQELKYPLDLVINPGETCSLQLFFWSDSGQVKKLTDLQAEKYSVTVKLLSRAA